MPTPQYQPAPKNAQAVRVAHSWLRAVNVPATDSARPGCDIAVKCADGAVIDVALVLSFEDELPDSAGLVVLAGDMANPNLDVAFEALHVITEEAGYGRPVPVDRGPRIRVYGDDFFLVCARHTEFRRAPDMPSEKQKKYAPLVARACRSFFAKNAKLCAMHGYEVQDLTTYAWTWTNIFVHSYEVRKETNAQGDDNERLFTKYMKDQFFHLFKQMLDANKKLFPDPDTVHIALMGRTFDENHSVEKYSTDPREGIATQLDASGDDRFSLEEPKEVSADRRRRAAAKVLKENLARLPHDVMVQKLKETSENENRDYQTRREARRLLRVHAKGCAACENLTLPLLATQGAVEVGGRGKETEAGVDALGGEEGPLDFGQ